MQHYHEESFTFDELPAEIQAEVIHDENTSIAGNEVSTTFSIQLTKSGVTVQCAPDQFVLDAARSAGLRLPSSCSKGLCGTCKSKLVSGQVEMKHGGGIRQREIDQGLFLPCCAKPLSDLVIER
jgi:ferredoxin